MSLELAGVSRIDTPAEARGRARKWLSMAREIDTPGAPLEAKEKAAELRQRAKAAQDWARREEDALLHAQHAHDDAAGEERAPDEQVRQQVRHGRVRRSTSSRARGAGNRAYHAAKPPALRLRHGARQHFFQGLSQPFGTAAGGWDLVFEGLGLSLAVVILYDLLRTPKAIGETSVHTLGFLERAIAVRDPISGLSPRTAAAPRQAPTQRRAPTARTTTA